LGLREEDSSGGGVLVKILSLSRNFEPPNFDSRRGGQYYFCFSENFDFWRGEFRDEIDMSSWRSGNAVAPLRIRCPCASMSAGHQLLGCRTAGDDTDHTWHPDFRQHWKRCCLVYCCYAICATVARGREPCIGLKRHTRTCLNTESHSVVHSREHSSWPAVLSKACASRHGMCGKHSAS